MIDNSQIVFGLLCIVVALHSRNLIYAMERTVQQEGEELRHLYFMQS